MQEVGDTGVVELTAILAPRPHAAALVTREWDAGRAVVVLDPAAPRPAIEAAMARLRPTHVADAGGRRPVADGLPVAAAVAAVVLTSGTTGTPKGVELPKAGVAAIGLGFASVIGHEADDRWLLCVPLHHVAGLAILARARATGAAVTVRPGFDPTDVADAPGRDGATLVSLVPTMLARVLRAGLRLDGYRRIVTGGAPVPPRLRARAEEAGGWVVESYGQSETWGGVVLDGVAIPGVRVRLGAGDEIEVDGTMTMCGYRLDPDATRAARRADGWLRTGDVGMVGPDGRLRVIDRLRDLVITGGVNVAPVEVEHVLSEHPAVADVAIGGRPDPEWGERVVAYVVPADPSAPPTLAQLRAFAAEQLAAVKLPRELVLLDTIPRGPSGKVLRACLDPERAVTAPPRAVG